MMRSRGWTIGFSIPISVALAACGEDLAIRSLLVPRPADHVVVYTFPYFIPAGDTIRVTAFAYDSTGHGTQFSAARSWTLSDDRIARLEPLPEPEGVLLRGLSPGRVVVTAVTVGRTGRDSVWVLPADARVLLQIASTTMRLRDTLVATVILQNADPAAISRRWLLASTDDLNIIEVTMTDTLGHARLVAKGIGTARTAATLGRLRTELVLTVTP